MSQSIGDFATLLRSVRRSVVHLELRDVYDIGNEADGFRAWREGHRLDPGERASWWRPWLDLVQEVTAQGVSMRRARVVSEPPSEYIRYEHSFTFTNVAAGEDVRWLPRRRAATLLLPGADFWLFDEQIVQFNIFDGDGRWTETDQTEDPAVALACAAAFEAVWERAVPHAEYHV